MHKGFQLAPFELKTHRGSVFIWHSTSSFLSSFNIADTLFFCSQARPRGVGGIVGIERKLEQKSRETDDHINTVSVLQCTIV